jgi:hypothetical protein
VQNIAVTMQMHLGRWRRRRGGKKVNGIGERKVAEFRKLKKVGVSGGLPWLFQPQAPRHQTSGFGFGLVPAKDEAEMLNCICKC